MKRRGFILLLGGAAALPLLAQAQQPGKIYRIAVVYAAGSVDEWMKARNLKGSQSWHFYEELGRLGFVDGQNLVVERHSGAGRLERFAELAGDVVRSKPDLIIAFTTTLALAFKGATTTIPIVAATLDPVANGIVLSLARPGGNITGISYNAGPELSGKYLELLRSAIPAVSRVGFLATRPGWEDSEGVAIRAAAQRIQISLIGPPLENPVDAAEYRRVIAAMARGGVEALIVHDAQTNFVNQRLIVELVEKGRLPAIFANREAVELGGFMAYAPDALELLDQLANRVAQILKGTKPSDIPYYQVAKFRLVINLKTAKALGVTVPPSLRALADEVIE
jgi:putative tryptophan/tyrosine transport system substrate-binding protein